MMGLWGKRGSSIVIILTLLFMQTGCWDRTELNDVALIMAVGIDQATDKTVEVSVQLLNPRAATSTSSKEAITLVRTGKGKNFAQAIDQLQEKSSRRLFWGHTKVVVFGEKMAKKGLLNEIDLLVRFSQPRISTYYFISNKTAKEILNVFPGLERYTGEQLRELAELQMLPSVTQKEFRGFIREGAQASFIPYIGLDSIQTGEKKREHFPVNRGFAVIKKGQMVGTISGKSGKIKDVLLWMQNKKQSRTQVTIKPKGYKDYISVRFFENKVKVTPLIIGDKWIIKLEGQFKGNVIQSNKANIMNPNTTKTIEGQLEKDIKGRFLYVIKDLQTKCKADIFDFDGEFDRHYHQEYKKVKKNWDEKFATLEIEVNANVKIVRPGLATRPTYGTKKRGVEE